MEIIVRSFITQQDYIFESNTLQEYRRGKTLERLATHFL